MILISAALMSCGEKKDSTQTEKKDGDMKTKVTDSVRTSTSNTTTTNTTTTTNQTTQKMDSAKSNETAAKQETKSDGDFVKMETSMGTIKIKLYTKEAPLTTGNFKKLISEGFYDGIIFHRVIDGFMLQGGDPTGTGTGGSKERIKDEFGPGLKHSKKGMLSMANSGPNSGSSQFFITLAETPWLDGKHAIFGEVVGGMDVVEKIGKTKTGPNDKPTTEIKMTKVTLTDK